MSTTKTMRQKIVEAARKRFTHYGYGKTTMAEVAGDCNMSSGNLYRYFPGKLDIAEEIGRESAQRLLEAMQEAARGAAPRASDMLRACLHKLLDETFNYSVDDANIFEMIILLRRERPGFFEWHTNAERDVIAGILANGNRSGEFQLADPQWTAELIRSATVKFHFPQLYVDTPLEGLHRELDGVLDLLLKGLSTDAQAAASSRRTEGEGERPRGASAGFI